MSAEPTPHPVDVPASSPATGAGAGMRLPPLAEVARSLAAALDLREVMQRVSTSAVELTRAYGAHVEQIISADGVVEVVARAGEGTPSVGTRVPYPGSLTEEIIEAGIPTLVAEIGKIGRSIAPYLAESCEGCSALVVPLVSERQILGTLVLLGLPGAEFGDEELTHARVLGDLASVSLRRVLLLEAAERERREKTSLLERISDAFFALDRDWRFTFLNRAAREVVESTTGGDPGEVVGRGFMEVLPHLRGTGIERELRRALDGQLAVHAEECLPARGTWLEIHAYPSDNGLSVFVRDVTARKRAEANLRLLARTGAVLSASLDYRTTLAHVARLAVPTLADWCVVDVVEDGRVERVEVAHADPEKGVRAEELRRYPPDPRDATTPSGRVLRTGKPELVPEITPEALRESERSPEHVRLLEEIGMSSLMVVPMVARGEAIGTLAFVAAESRRRYGPDDLALAEELADRAAVAVDNARLFRQAEQRADEIERVTESRARLIRGFSHDLKNPLGAADGHAQLLEDGILGELAPRQQESVKRIRATIRSALGLIQDLVELARAEAGQIELEIAPADVGEVAREIAEEYRAQAESAGLHVAAEVPAGLPRVSSDRARVRQVLGNLVSNAVKYNRDGGSVALRVALRRRDGEPSGDWMAVEVADTGSGIPADKRHLLFREFSRLEPGAAHGAGLGLAISQRIAQALGGEITLESEVGVGSTFTLWLPVDSDTPPHP